MKNEVLEDLVLLVREWLSQHVGELETRGAVGMAECRINLASGEIVTDACIESYGLGGVSLIHYADQADGSLKPFQRSFVPYGRISSIVEKC
jgi:hypothetical protein